MGRKWRRILKTPETLTLTLNEVESHRGVPSRGGTWSDFRFHRIPLAAGGRLD